MSENRPEYVKVYAPIAPLVGLWLQRGRIHLQPVFPVSDRLQYGIDSESHEPPASKQ